MAASCPGLTITWLLIIDSSKYLNISRERVSCEALIEINSHRRAFYFLSLLSSGFRLFAFLTTFLIDLYCPVCPDFLPCLSIFEDLLCGSSWFILLLNAYELSLPYCILLRLFYCFQPLDFSKLLFVFFTECLRMFSLHCDSIHTQLQQVSQQNCGPI